jgi:hypothetical protein
MDGHGQDKPVLTGFLRGSLDDHGRQWTRVWQRPGEPPPINDFRLRNSPSPHQGRRHNAALELSSSQSLMFIRLWLALCAFVLLASVALAAPKPSTPKECPVTEHSLDAIEAAIEKAPSCEQSMDIFQTCAYGASGDVALGQAVIGKCEGDFLGKLNTGQKRAYEQEIKRCWRKYRREGGTMYRSLRPCALPPWRRPIHDALCEPAARNSKNSCPFRCRPGDRLLPSVSTTMFCTR